MTDDNSILNLSEREILDFEAPIIQLLQRIAELQQTDLASSLTEEIRKLKAQVSELQEKVFSELTAHQKVLLSRHPRRPYTLDYIDEIFDDFEELHGDRSFRDDPALVGGLARLGPHEILVLGHQKGRNTNDNLIRNFGMPKPEGYRKATRLMRLASRFRRPIISLVDTPGAYPGLGAEERGQAEAIAKSLQVMFSVKSPIITTVIGEGGSGGALAIGVCDRLLMLQYSTYSVISPEGCAAILWRDPAKASEAAEQLRMSADDILELGVCDEIIPEAEGGAHRDPKHTAAAIKEALSRHLEELLGKSERELLDERYSRLRSIGVYEELT